MKQKKNSQQTARLRAIYETVFEENQSLMARELGFAQATVSRMLSGGQPMSRRFRTALEKHELVSREFLVTGTGSPGLPVSSRKSAETLPLTRVPLPGDPRQWSQLIVGTWAGHPVVPGGSCYALEVSRESPLLQASKLNILAGDILIVETAPEARQHLEFLLQQLCLIRLTEDAGKSPQSVVPARLQPHRGAGTGEEASYLMAEPVGNSPGQRTRYRGLTLPEGETSKAKSSSGSKTPKVSDSSTFPIDQGQIVGVVVELRRRNVLG